MAVTTRARKRLQRDSKNPQKWKHFKNGDVKEINTIKRKPRKAVGAKYKSLNGAHFPLEILGLPHVLKRINTLAMKPEEAVIAAVRMNRVKWLRQLLKRSDCTASQAMEYAATKGQVETVKALLPTVMGPGHYTLDGSVVTDLTKAAVSAAREGHLEVVETLLGEIGDERDDEHDREFVHEDYEQDIEAGKNDAAWEILDAAAANGHVRIVEYASGFAEDDEYLPASERSSALSSAISAGHMDVVQFLRESTEYSWGSDGDSEDSASEDDEDSDEEETF